MIRVEFENRFGKRRELGCAEDDKSAMTMIMNFLVGFNYKAPYYRTWSPEVGHMVVDVGSHSEFFHLYDEIECVGETND